MNSRSLNLHHVYYNWLALSIAVSKFRKEGKFCPGLFTSSIKREIGLFHVVVVQWRERNVQKKCAARAVIVLRIKPIAFFAVPVAAAVILSWGLDLLKRSGKAAFPVSSALISDWRRRSVCGEKQSAEPKLKKKEKWGDRQKALLRTSFVVSNPCFVSSYNTLVVKYDDIFDKIDICQCISIFFSFCPVMISLFLFL